jgi:hypothetical protein
MGGGTDMRRSKFKAVMPKDEIIVARAISATLKLAARHPKMLDELFQPRPSKRGPQRVLVPVVVRLESTDDPEAPRVRIAFVVTAKRTMTVDYTYIAHTNRIEHGKAQVVDLPLEQVFES